MASYVYNAISLISCVFVAFINFIVMVLQLLFKCMNRITQGTQEFAVFAYHQLMWLFHFVMSFNGHRNSGYTNVSMSSDGLYYDITEQQWPIVYAPQYNIGFCGLEKLHPFDSKKWGRVYEILERNGMVHDRVVVRPPEARREDLRVVHTPEYLDSLDGCFSGCTVARVTEVPPVCCLCSCCIQPAVLRPLRYQTAGSIVAAKLATERGWAINIGGGFHHCHAENGGGFCVYADITLAIKFLMKDRIIERAMIIDLDAHQGNGHERDFMNNDNVYIMDVYNRGIYPHDEHAKRAIRRNVPLQHYMQDAEYLHLVNMHVTAALKEFSADIVIYNAGTDILEGDPLGQLSISAQGIIARDEAVFKLVMDQGVPIVMYTSGGYQRRTADIIAQSVMNLYRKGLIKQDSRHVRRRPTDQPPTLMHTEVERT